MIKKDSGSSDSYSKSQADGRFLQKMELNNLYYDLDQLKEKDIDLTSTLSSMGDYMSDMLLEPLYLLTSIKPIDAMNGLTQRVDSLIDLKLTTLTNYIETELINPLYDTSFKTKLNEMSGLKELIDDRSYANLFPKDPDPFTVNIVRSDSDIINGYTGGLSTDHSFNSSNYHRISTSLEGSCGTLSLPSGNPDSNLKKKTFTYSLFINTIGIHSNNGAVDIFIPNRVFNRVSGEYFDISSVTASTNTQSQSFSIDFYIITKTKYQISNNLLSGTFSDSMLSTRVHMVFLDQFIIAGSEPSSFKKIKSIYSVCNSNGLTKLAYTCERFYLLYRFGQVINLNKQCFISRPFCDLLCCYSEDKFGKLDTVSTDYYPITNGTSTGNLLAFATDYTATFRSLDVTHLDRRQYFLGWL